MEVIDNGIVKKLMPEVGHMLTRKSESDYRVFSEVIYLGVNDSEDNYEEWKDDDVNAWVDAHNKSKEEHIVSLEEKVKDSMLYKLINKNGNG